MQGFVAIRRRSVALRRITTKLTSRPRGPRARKQNFFAGDSYVIDPSANTKFRGGPTWFDIV